MNRTKDGRLGWADSLNEKQMMVGFVEGVCSDVTIVVHQPRHLHFFIRLL